MFPYDVDVELVATPVERHLHHGHAEHWSIGLMRFVLVCGVLFFVPFLAL